MISDFHIHYAPEKIVKEKLGDAPFKLIKSNGIPSYSYHPRLYNVEQLAETLEFSAVDAAYISCAAGMEGGDMDLCRFINDDLYQWNKQFPRVKGLVHTRALDNKDGFKEIDRGLQELGFKGVAIASQVEGLDLDDEQLFPFYEKVEKSGAFLFIHPCLAVPGKIDAFDMARSVGREFNLIMGTIRLINGGVVERFPNLRIIMSHLGGGIAAMLGRVRKYQDKAFWGTAGDPIHGKVPQNGTFMDNFRKIYFDTGGFIGEMNAVKAALLEMVPEQMVFGSDYPQEIRAKEDFKVFVDNVRDLGPVGDQILRGTAKNLVK